MCYKIELKHFKNYYNDLLITVIFSDCMFRYLALLNSGEPTVSNLPRHTHTYTPYHPPKQLSELVLPRFLTSCQRTLVGVVGGGISLAFFGATIIHHTDGAGCCGRGENRQSLCGKNDEKILLLCV